MLLIEPQNLSPMKFSVTLFFMKAVKKTSQVFQIKCPCCRSKLWIDPLTSAVIKSEKGKKEKESLDVLLQKEKKKKKEFDRKFEATSEMQKERRKKAQEIFERALTSVDEKD
jgi:hypothetical protein